MEGSLKLCKSPRLVHSMFNKWFRVRAKKTTKKSLSVRASLGRVGVLPAGGHREPLRLAGAHGRLDRTVRRPRLGGVPFTIEKGQVFHSEDDFPAQIAPLPNDKTPKQGTQLMIPLASGFE